MFLTFRACLIIFICSIQGSTTIISPCARWNTTGRTVAGNGQAGSSSYQINSAKGLFVHRNEHALYVADFYNNRVQRFALNESIPKGVTVASNVESPMKVFVDDDETGPTVYVSLRFLNRTEKWISGASQGIRVGDDCRLCSGVTVDKDKNVYMSESDRQRITKWSPKTNETIVIAGQTNTRGSSNNLLDHPQGIYLSNDGDSIYIADMWNSRIQRWIQGDSKGTTVAGSASGIAGNDSQTLNFPNDVIVDDETNIIYVIDSSNNRVQRWLPQSNQGDTIAGLGGKGTSPTQLNKPVALDFDKFGNLYVLDMENNRVQMFELIENRPCRS